MARILIARIEMFADVESSVLSCAVQCETSFFNRCKESEEIQAQLIAPFVDAYKIITGRELIAARAPDALKKRCEDCESVQPHELDSHCQCGGIYK